MYVVISRVKKAECTLKKLRNSKSGNLWNWLESKLMPAIEKDVFFLDFQFSFSFCYCLHNAVHFSRGFSSFSDETENLSWLNVTVFSQMWACGLRARNARPLICRDNLTTQILHSNFVQILLLFPLLLFVFFFSESSSKSYDTRIIKGMAIRRDLFFTELTFYCMSILSISTTTMKTFRRGTGAAGSIATF